MLTGEIDLTNDIFGQIARSWDTGIMLLVGFVLIYLAISKGFEPLLLIPIGIGVVLANLFSGLVEEGGILYLFKEVGLNTQLFPLLMFLGLGALTDFSGLLQRPFTALMGAAAQVGIFGALIGAILLGFNLSEAGAIAIIAAPTAPRPSTSPPVLRRSNFGAPLPFPPIPTWPWCPSSSPPSCVC